MNDVKLPAAIEVDVIEPDIAVPVLAEFPASIQADALYRATRKSAAALLVIPLRVPFSQKSAISAGTYFRNTKHENESHYGTHRSRI